MAEQRTALTGWGRTAPTVARVQRPASAEALAELIERSNPRGVLARGLGRSYGDAAQNAGGVVMDLSAFDDISDIDPVTGRVTCGAGVTLDALLRHIVPLGWFVPVTPGTRQVTIGGAIAADVHGKNHHLHGSFANHVEDITLVDGLGRTHTLTPSDDLFWAVPGGMGLTGVVTSVTLRLRSIDTAWMTVETFRTSDLDDTLATLLATDRDTTYSVAWIDCLARGRHAGRGVITNAEHTPRAELSRRDRPLEFQPRSLLTAPPWAPRALLNRASVGLFNSAYYRMAGVTPARHQQHVASYFHPLDSLSAWNRLYGTTGFVQYQFVSPDVTLIADALARLRALGAPGLLTVLKRFGEANPAPLSFPAAGWTLAVDIPARIPELGRLLDDLDDVVAGSGGRVYLAKDSRLRSETLAAMYPRIDRWRSMRATLDPRGVFRSDLARRLAL